MALYIGLLMYRVASMGVVCNLAVIFLAHGDSILDGTTMNQYLK
jgi:hypothetical protein